MSIVVPSPELLIHGTHKHYVTQISNNERKINKSRQGSNPIKEESTTNLSLMCLNGINPTIRKARAYSSVIASDLLLSDNPSSSLFYGALAAETNDIHLAIYWYQNAIKKGSVIAMRLVAYLYFKRALRLSQKKRSQNNQERLIYDPFSLNEALKWFYRAAQQGCIKSYRYIGDIYYLFGTEMQSFSFYMQYFNSIILKFPYTQEFPIQSCLYAKYRIAKLFVLMNRPISALLWFISCADMGDPKSAKQLMLLLRDPSVIKVINEYHQIPENIDILSFLKKKFDKEIFEIPSSRKSKATAHSKKEIEIKNERNLNGTILDYSKWKQILEIIKQNLPSKKFDSHLEIDLTLPSYKNTSHFFWLIDPLSNNLQYNLQQNSQQENSFVASGFEQSNVLNLNDVSNTKMKGSLMNSNKFQSVQSPFYPLKSKTDFLKMTFKFASPSFTKRNLAVSYSFLQRMNYLHPKGITESLIFRNRCKSSNPKYLVQCGFIAIMSYDSKYALSLFQKAAQIGNETASLMVGLMLFHGLNVTQQMKNGCYYLSQCTTNPIALLHLSLACNDDLWEKRAQEILAMEPTYDPMTASITKGSRYKMYEWVGDLFSDFVKFPINMGISLMFYGMAMKKAEEDGEDITEIIQKMTKVSREPGIDH